MSIQENNINNNTDNNNQVNDELTQEIKQEQEKELSYIMEVSQVSEQRTKYLAKKNEYKIMFDNGKSETFTRKPLSSRKNREIDELRAKFTTKDTDIKVNGKVFADGNAVLHEAYRKTAEYCLGLTDEQYDSAIWEDFPEYMDKDIYGLQDILIACWIRNIHGVAYFPQASKNL